MKNCMHRAPYSRYLNVHLCAPFSCRLSEETSFAYYMTDMAKIYVKTLDYGGPFWCFIYFTLTITLVSSFRFLFCVLTISFSLLAWYLHIGHFAHTHTPRALCNKSIGHIVQTAVKTKLGKIHKICYNFVPLLTYVNKNCCVFLS